MDFSRTIYSLVGVLVAVIMIATVAMPAITSASTTTTTTTTTEVQDVEVSDPIYYKNAYGMCAVRLNDEGIPVIMAYDSYYYKEITYNGDVGIPLVISDSLVAILYKSESSYYICCSGETSSGYSSEIIDIDGFRVSFNTDGGYFKLNIQNLNTNSSTGTNYTFPRWSFIVSHPEYGGTFLTSASQDAVTLGSLNEVVAGSAYYTNISLGTFSYIRNGEQTQYGDQALELDSVQTDAGVDVSLKASYGDTEVLILVPTTTEITVTQTITVQSEYGPILNVVLLMLLIIPVTAVAAMLYTRRD